MNQPLTYSRTCPLCGQHEGKRFLEGKWPLTAIGTVEMAYRICDGCGLVRTDPLVRDDLLERYYSTMSAYSDIYSSAKLTPLRQRTLQLALDHIAQHHGGVKEQDVLEIGCADGAQLYELAKLGANTLGVEPSKSRAAFAKSHYGLTVIESGLEVFQPEAGKQFDLILLCQILEHLPDPLVALAKIRSLLKPTGGFYLETPLLCEPEAIRYPGYFQFEHIQYFTVQTLEAMLNKAGFIVEGKIEPDFDSTYTPVMRAYVKLGTVMEQFPAPSHIEEIKQWINRHEPEERQFWQQFENLVKQRLPQPCPIVIWGGGVHTSILLARTKIAEYCEIKGIIDSDPAKAGSNLGGYPVLTPDQFFDSYHKLPVVISSFGGEHAIHEQLLQHGITEDNFIRLYHETGMNTARWFT